MAATIFNNIYKELVKGEDDAIGLFAYSLYKTNKILFVEKKKLEENRDPTDEELKNFYESSMLTGQINVYRNEGERLLSLFLNKTFSTSILEVEEEIKQSIMSSKLDEIKKSIEAKRSIPGWFARVFSNLTVSVLTIVLVGSIVLGHNTYNYLTSKTQESVGLSKILNSPQNKSDELLCVKEPVNKTC